MWVSYIQLTLAMIMAGSSFVVAKQLTSIHPIIVSGLSFVTAVIPFAIYTFAKEGFKRLDRKNLFYIFLQAFFGAFTVRLIINVGVNYTSALEAGIVLSTVPAITLLLAKIILKEKITLTQIIGITLVLVGTVVINVKGKSMSTQDGISLTGNLLLLLGVVSSSLFTILGKKVEKTISTYTHTTYILIFATVLYIPLILGQMSEFSFSLIETEQYLYILYYGIIATALSYFLWFKGLSKVNANIAGAFMGIMPLSSTILSILILGEKLTLQLSLGLILILIGITATTLKRFNLNK